ncbi:MAG: methylase, partial [Rhodobacteraceae bacterium]|nr:methylase [Paracoccaceae bacterium]
MANQSSKRTRSIPPKSHLQHALSQIGGEIDERPLRSSSLARIMRETYHGNDAAGAWDWRMAYDMMQAAAVMQVVTGTGHDTFAIARLLASRLLTETRRSEQQIRLQQFSTPLPYAALATRAAAIRP